MKTLFKSFLVLNFFLLPLCSAAQNNSGAINKIFKEIPIQERLEETAQEMHDFFTQNPFQITPSQNEKVVTQFGEAYQADSLKKVAMKTFSKNSQSDFADSTLEWLQQEITQRVLQTEKDYYTLQGIRKRVVHQYELEQNPPAQDRIELIKAMVESRSAAESEVEYRMIMFRAMLSALSELENPPFNDMQTQAIASNYRTQLQSQIDQELTNKFLIMYYKLDNETLQTYDSFFKTAAGRWLSDTNSKSIHSAYEEAGDRFQKSMTN